MEEEVQLILEETNEMMDNSIVHLKRELVKISTGKANPLMLQSVRVDYYGVSTPLSQVANINTPDAKTITIQPWEKAMLEPCATAIIYANLGLNPQNNGEILIISVPPLTEERRRDLVKQARKEAEEAKIGIRNARHNGITMIKDLEKEGLSKDLAHDAEVEIQNLTNKHSDTVDEVVKEKEVDIMTV
jgi:ribosome recycling factor